MLSVALTGSSGFIGQHLIRLSNKHRIRIRPIAHCPSDNIFNSELHQSLAGCEALLHLGGRAHVLRETAKNPLEVFLEANTHQTLRLAKAAFACGVRRFIFVSSIGVLGDHSSGLPLHPSDSKAPSGPYAISKAEAELSLERHVAQTGHEVLIIRPPLVHGPGVKGNFARLCEAIHAGKPLPLGSVGNRRSFVGVDNLANAIMTATMTPWPEIMNPPAESARLKGEPVTRVPRVYHIADDGVISTRRLVEVLAEGMGVKPRLVNVPRWLAVGGATLLGKGAVARRLFDDLEVDDSDFRRDFAWKPAIGLEDGLRAMAADFARRMREGSTTSVGPY